MQLLVLLALGVLQFGWVAWPDLGLYVGMANAAIILGIVVAGGLSRCWGHRFASTRHAGPPRKNSGTPASVSVKGGGAEGRDGRRGGRADGLITASEVASFAYCAEQWRLQYGLGLPAGNRAALDAGTRHHARKAAAERLAGRAVRLGRVIALAGLLLLALWLMSR